MVYNEIKIKENKNIGLKDKITYVVIVWDEVNTKISYHYSIIM